MLLLDFQLIMSMDLCYGALGGEREKGIGSALMNPEVAGGVALYFGSDKVCKSPTECQDSSRQRICKQSRLFLSYNENKHCDTILNATYAAAT